VPTPRPNLDHFTHVELPEIIDGDVGREFIEPVLLVSGEVQQQVTAFGWLLVIQIPNRGLQAIQHPRGRLALVIPVVSFPEQPRAVFPSEYTVCTGLSVEARQLCPFGMDDLVRVVIGREQDHEHVAASRRAPLSGIAAQVEVKSP